MSSGCKNSPNFIGIWRGGVLKLHFCVLFWHVMACKLYCLYQVPVVHNGVIFVLHMPVIFYGMAYNWYFRHSSPCKSYWFYFYFYICVSFVVSCPFSYSIGCILSRACFTSVPVILPCMSAVCVAMLSLSFILLKYVRHVNSCIWWKK